MQELIRSLYNRIIDVMPIFNDDKNEWGYIIDDIINYPNTIANSNLKINSSCIYLFDVNTMIFMLIGNNVDNE